jgi:hypothetical protein
MGANIFNNPDRVMVHGNILIRDGWFIIVFSKFGISNPGKLTTIYE